MRYIFELDPVPKGRPRFSSVCGVTRAFTPSKTRRFEADVKNLAIALHKDLTIVDPIAVKIQFFLRRPKTVTRDIPSVKPDLENLLKSFIDGCNGVIWEDDSLIVDIIATKRYGERGYIVMDVERI